MRIKLFISLFLLSTSLLSWASEFPDMFKKSGKTASNIYAIVVVGGSEEGRHLWDGAKTYQFLTRYMGVPKNHIKACSGGGDSGTFHDFDGDGSRDVNYPSTIDGITKAFNAIGSITNANNEFIFFIVDHGGNDNISLFKDGIQSQKLAQLLKTKIPCNKVNVWLHACHSGSFIDDLKNHDRSLTIITSTSGDQTAHGDENNGSDLFDPFYGALSGQYRIKNNDNVVTAGNLEADYNNDGVVSYEEAFVFAKDNDDAAPPLSTKLHPTAGYNDIPRFWSSDTEYRFCRHEDWGVLDVPNTITTDTNKEAMYLLNANNIIKNNAKVTYSSGKFIRLKKGFHVVKGAKFKTARIDCEKEKSGIYEGELRHLTVGEDEFYEESFEEPTTSNLTLYPNPTDGEFYISFAKEDVDFNIFITDMTGKTVYSTSGTGHDQNVNLEGLASGVYFVRISTNELTETRKVILR